MMGPVWLLLALLPGRLGHVVDLPGCPFEKQTAFCLGSATCHSLAHSGLTCEGMADIQEGICRHDGTTLASTTQDTTSAGGSSTQVTSSSLGPAAVLRISMMVEVSDPQEYLAYFDDEAVREAYVNVMSEVASVPKELVDLKRTSNQLGFITVIYVITVPYEGDTPSIPLTSIQEKLSSIDIPSFNELLNAEMREVAGAVEGEGVFLNTRGRNST
eukprot:Skav202343  [mRNA]  locus=scaffold2638:50786:51706:- [translate_table: standard]